MRNLNRGYLRIALAVGLTVGPLFTGLGTYRIRTSTDYRHAALGPRRLGALVPPGPRAITGVGVIAVITWTVLWVATGLVGWTRRAFDGTGASSQ